MPERKSRKHTPDNEDRVSSGALAAINREGRRYYYTKGFKDKKDAQRHAESSRKGHKHSRARVIKTHGKYAVYVSFFPT